MNRLDNELREALRRQDPGPDFTARVLAAAAAARPKESRWRTSWWRTFVAGFGPARVRWATAGALACLLVVGGSLEYQEWQGRRAKQQLVLALHIAGAKLNLARDQVRQINAGD
jgi:hypothetical protein